MSVERQGYQQILRGTSGPLAVTFCDAAGAIADPGDVTVTITRLDGSIVVTDGATSGTGAAARTRALTPAESAELDRLTCAWSGTVDGAAQEIRTEAEVIGDLLFTVAAARDVHERVMASEEKFPTVWIEDGRWRILDAFEERCNVAFVPRIRQVTLDGHGRDRLWLPNLRILRVRSIEIRERGSATWTAFDEDDLADVVVEPMGRITRESRGVFPAGRQNVRVTYEHGYQRVPGEISQAGLMVLRHELVKPGTPISDRATSTSVENVGTFSLATAGTRPSPFAAYRYYGLPMVDARLHEYRETVRGGS